jgi:DNA-damage-inducible protein J
VNIPRFEQLNDEYIVRYGEYHFARSPRIDLQRKLRYYKSEVITMDKTMTRNLRVNPTVKQQAEVCAEAAWVSPYGKRRIDMYLRQITLTGGIPFSLSLPKAPAALKADTMTDEQLHCRPANGHQGDSER